MTPKIKLLILTILAIPTLVYGDAAMIGSLCNQSSGGGGSSCSGDYGYTTAGGTDDQGNSAGDTFCTRIALSCNGTVSSASVYGQWAGDSSKEWEFALYDDAGSGADPNNLLGNYGANFDSGSGTAKWMTDSSIGEVITGSPSYVWLCWMIEASITELEYNSSGSTPARYSSQTWGTWPDPWPTSTDTEYTTRDYSLYITF